MLRIKYERLRKGWTQVHLSFHANVGLSEISLIESGRLRPSPTQLDKLAKALKLDRDAALQDVSDEQRGADDPPPGGFAA